MIAGRKTVRKTMSIDEVQEIIGADFADERGLEAVQCQAVEMDTIFVVEAGKVKQVRVEMTYDE